MLWLSNFTEISYFYAPWKPLFFWRLQMVWKRNMRITTSNIFVLKGRPKHKFFSIDITLITWKVSKYGVFSSPYFPAFGLKIPPSNSVSLRIQSECAKIRTRKTPYLDTFHAVMSAIDKHAPLKTKKIKRNQALCTN